jgi:hypothetical protein
LIPNSFPAYAYFSHSRRAQYTTNLKNRGQAKVNMNLPSGGALPIRILNMDIKYGY